MIKINLLKPKAVVCNETWFISDEQCGYFMIYPVHPDHHYEWVSEWRGFMRKRLIVEQRQT